MALAERGVKAEPKSKFDTWIDSLNENNKAVVLGWLNDPEYKISELVRMIRPDDPEDDYKGYPVTKETITGWRQAHVAQ